MVVIVSDLGVIAESSVCASVHLSVRNQVYAVYNLNMNTECDYIGNSSVGNYHPFPAQAFS